MPRGFTPYLTLGANYVGTELYVHAQTSGEADRTTMAVDTWTFSLETGLGDPLTEDMGQSSGDALRSVFLAPVAVSGSNGRSVGTVRPLLPPISLRVLNV